MTKFRSAFLVAALLVGLTACGSDDDDTDATTDPSGDVGDDTAGDDTGDDGASDGGDADDGSSDGGATGVVVMADGTEYVLDVFSCDTSSTDPGGFPFPNSFDLQGDSDDGFQFYIARAPLSEDGDVVQTGYLEGDYDENGKNAGIIYKATMSTMEFTVDGADVSGSVSMKSLYDAGPHGEETTATFEFSC